MTSHSISKPFSILVAVAVAVCLGCGGKQPDSGAPPVVEPFSTPTGSSGLVFQGTPDVEQNGVGLSAAADGSMLLVTVFNKSEQPIVVGPEQFRLVMPNRQLVALDPARHGLSGFQIRTVPVGGEELFLAQVRDTPLIGTGLAFQNPPANVLLKTTIRPTEKRASVVLEDDEKE